MSSDGSEKWPRSARSLGTGATSTPGRIPLYRQTYYIAWRKSKPQSSGRQGGAHSATNCQSVGLSYGIRRAAGHIVSNPDGCDIKPGGCMYRTWKRHEPHIAAVALTGSGLQAAWCAGAGELF